MQYGHYPSPRFTVAHLSDVHLLAHGVKQYGVVEPEAGLQLALERLGRLDPVPQALVFTGDLADKAEPDAYARLRELVEPVAADLGAQVVWVIGNHDERAPYAKGLFDSDDDGPQDRVYDVGGLRIVALDTSVPEYHHGELLPEQLDWLRDVAEHAAPSTAPSWRCTTRRSRCRPWSRPRSSSCSTRTGSPRWSRAATCGRSSAGTSTTRRTRRSRASRSRSPRRPATRPTRRPADRLISGVDGHQAFNMVHVYDDRIVHTVIPIPEAPEVSGQPAAMREALDALSPEERREIISRKDSDFNNPHRVARASGSADRPLARGCATLGA